MKLSLFSTITFLFLGTFGVSGRVTTADSIAADPGRAGGVYYAYPITNDSQVSFTATPDGYEPFYASHYGRHGSRYLISDEDYTRVKKWLDRAYKDRELSPRGELLKHQIDTILIEANGRGGELTPLGNRQHHAIARRLITTNPEIFEGSPDITATSTVVMRCAHSMFAFIEALKEVNPTLTIPRESGQRDMIYMNYHTPESNTHSGHNGTWYPLWRNFRNRQTNPDRLMASLFNNKEKADYYVDTKEAMWDLYWITVDLQNMETDIRLYDLFTPDELYDLWQVFNYNFYACNSSYPDAEGTHTDNAQNLLRNIVTTSDSYIAEGKNGATLRFGHDGNIIPLVALMRLNDCYAYEVVPERLAESYADYSISPMAANLQLIFYRPKASNYSGDDVLVKVMLNEREIAFDDLDSDIYPYYRWNSLRPLLEQYITTPSAAYIPANH